MALFVQQFKSNPEVYYREIDSEKQSGVCTKREPITLRFNETELKNIFFPTDRSVQISDICIHYVCCPGHRCRWIFLFRVCPAFDIKSSRMKMVCAYLRTSKSLLSKKRRKVVSKLRSCAVADIISTPFRTLPSQVWLSPFSSHSFSTATCIFLTSIIYESRAHFEGREKTFVKS